ncbi:MAG TPA: DUF6351 family protein [Casimicrobiaceae bacterium]|nr:DUF6351 family protein [Casimicrobiaceae bacterium]
MHASVEAAAGRGARFRSTTKTATAPRRRSNLQRYCAVSVVAGRATNWVLMIWISGGPGAPREVAGANVASDIIKCELKPIDLAEFGAAPLTPTQLSRLQSIYPRGGCDWSKPGIEQQPPAGVWQFF